MRTGQAPTCPEPDALVELALDHTVGRERARLLEHLERCAACRRHVDGLVAISDALLLAAIDAEPPARFESDVLVRITEAGHARHVRSASRLRAASAIVTASVMVVVAVAVVFLIGSREAPLIQATMVTPAGYEVGTAWAYEGQPSWVVVSVPDWQPWEQSTDPPDVLRLTAQLRDGTWIDLARAPTDRSGGTTWDGARDGTWAATTEVDPANIERLAIADDTGRIWCAAEF